MPGRQDCYLFTVAAPRAPGRASGHFGHFVFLFPSSHIFLDAAFSHLLFVLNAGGGGGTDTQRRIPSLDHTASTACMTRGGGGG